MLEYEGFLIQPVETEPGRWRARISRPNGSKIKVAVPAGAEHDSITMGGREAL